MTRCECAGMTFREVLARLRKGDVSPGPLPGGCGDLCTACLPDLDAYLKKRLSRPWPVRMGP